LSQTNANIAALIGSRICHDLISPVGAITNGLELLALGGTQAGPEFSLISDSAAHANARIRFFRIAFGIVSEGQMVSAAEIVSSVAGVFENKHRVHWGINGSMPRTVTQATFLALLCAEQAIPRGGIIDVKGNNSTVNMAIEGSKISFNSIYWDILDSGNIPENLPPAQVQFALLHTVLSSLDRKVTINARDTNFTLSF